MVSRVAQLAALERLARMKADAEIRQFAAIRQQMVGMRAHAAVLQQALVEEYARVIGAAPGDLPLAQACCQGAAQASLAIEVAIDRMTPAFELRRAAAVRAHGRAAALEELHHAARDEARRRRPD